MDDVKDDSRRPSLPVSSTISSSDVHYTPIEVVSAASNVSFASSAPIPPTTTIATAGPGRSFLAALGGSRRGGQRVHDYDAPLARSAQRQQQQHLVAEAPAAPGA